MEAEPAQEVFQDGESGDPPRVEDTFASPGTGRLAGKSWSSRFVHAGCLHGSCCAHPVSAAGPPRAVRWQTDRRGVRRNDGGGDRDVKRQKILKFTYDALP